MLICSAVISLVCAKSYYNSRGEENTQKIEFSFRLIVVIFILFWISWQIGDAVMFGTNQHLDGNDMDLEAW